MPASQPSTGLSIDLSVLSRETAEALRTFAAFLGKGGEAAEAFRSFVAFIGEGAERGSPEAFADFEIGLHKQLMGLGRAVIGKHVEGRDENIGPVRRDGRVFYRSTEATSKIIHTLFGPVTFFRPLYRSPGSPSFSPVDESLGLFDKYLTGPAARSALMLLCHCTPTDGAEIFKRLGGMSPSSSCLKRLLTKAGERWNEKEGMTDIREAETVPEEAASCTVSLDGVMVPLRPDGGREACWREASCGTVSFHDADGKRLRTVSLARMPEAGKATLKEQLAAEVAHVRKMRPDLPLVAVADAAPDNWTFLERLRPDERAVDFFHACEHLSEVADHAVATDWYDKYRTVLRDDVKGVDKVIRAIRHLRDEATGSALKILDRELAFFRKNKGRMRYASLKARSYPVGSGIVEAANKVLVNQRMKRAGMRWSIEGGQNVLTFRSLMRSGRFDAAWRAMTGTHAANQNQVPDAIAA